MIPSGQAKLIAESASVYCQNTFSRFGDLRPVKTDKVAATGATSDAKTLYRMSRAPGGSSFVDGSTGWRTHSNVVHYVRGPVAGDSTERTYYTGDGAPKATNLSGAVRNLGVAAPEAAPVVAVNAVAQMTPEEVTASYNDSLKAAVAAIREFVTGGADSRITPPGITGGVISSNEPWKLIYSFANTAENSYLLNAVIGGYEEGGKIKIGVTCRPAVAVLNENGLRSALSSLKMPDDDGPGDHEESDLLSADDIDRIISDIKAVVTVDCEYTKNKLAEMKAEFDSIVNVITEGVAASASSAALAAFYASDEVTLAIDRKSVV